MAVLRGGDKLADVLKTIGAKASSAKYVQVGFLENSTYPDGTSVPMVAAIQEFGAPKVGIPPRPFFRDMIAAKSKEWPKAIRDLLKDNDFDAAKTLGQVGEGVKGQLQQSIVDLTTPPLSKVTLMLRKMFGNNPDAIRGRDVAEARERVAAGEDTDGVSIKPLVWTGHLENSVDYQVKT